MGFKSLTYSLRINNILNIAILDIIATIAFCNTLY